MKEKKILRFVTQATHSKFKELIVTSPRLLRGLHSMSILKTVPDGLKARECERIKLDGTFLCDKKTGLAKLF